MIEKVSLIMTTYNCREHFKISIENALKQDYPCIELIIVDSKSTDGTLELIKEYSAKIEDGEYPGKSVKWISEKDNGIYDGMNKGIRMASGDVIAVFNDEFTTTRAISIFINALNKGNFDGVYSDLIYANGIECKRYWHMPPASIISGWLPAHPTMYLRKSVYDEFGLYKTEYRSSSDYEFMLRILKSKKVKMNYIPKVLIRMFIGGTSSEGMKGYIRNTKEAYRALRENRIPFPLITIFCRIIRTLRQYRLSKYYKEEM